MERPTQVDDRSFDIRDVVSRRSIAPLNPVILVSADSHVELPREDYLDYLEPRYRPFGEDYLREYDAIREMQDLLGYPVSGPVLELIDTRRAIRSGGELGACDPARRLRETEAEGVVAEMLHPNGFLSVPPFFTSATAPVSPELRAAGARAHNRFVTEFCQLAPERLLGVHLVYPWPDMEAAAQDCVRAADAGAKAVFPPQQAGAPGDPTPAFYDPSYDPFWAACQDLGLVVHIHAGWGRAQGSTIQILTALNRQAAEKGSTLAAEALDGFLERRPLWQLMWGGVFDRFPRLKVGFVEIHFDWVPGTLAYLDRYAAEHPTTLKLKPSEYWRRHCAIGASIMRYGDVAVRHEVGLEKVMFGTDYPHLESCWPNTWDFIHATLGELPEDEVRMILGENAIEFYGLDRRVLARAALRCGPLPQDILAGHGDVDPGILEHFHSRSGVRKPANLHEEELIRAVAEDTRQATLVRPA